MNVPSRDEPRKNKTSSRRRPRPARRSAASRLRSSAPQPSPDARPSAISRNDAATHQIDQSPDDSAAMVAIRVEARRRFGVGVSPLRFAPARPGGCRGEGNALADGEQRNALANQRKADERLGADISSSARRSLRARAPPPPRRRPRASQRRTPRVRSTGRTASETPGRERTFDGHWSAVPSGRRVQLQLDPGASSAGDHAAFSLRFDFGSSQRFNLASI